MARYDFLNNIEETPIFQYYKKHGNRAHNNVSIALRNKESWFRNKVSYGVKKYYADTFGNEDERFLSNISKKDNGCWEFNQTWISDTQPKEFSAKYYNLGFTKECIGQTCKNSKCINPTHLIEFDRDEQAKKMRTHLKLGRTNGHGKLSIKDTISIKEMYLYLFKKNKGKHRGIASIIHKEYPNVTLSTIVGIVKEVKPKYLIDDTPILMYMFDDTTGTKGQLIKKYSNIKSCVFDESRNVKALAKRNIIKVLNYKITRVFKDT